MKRLAVLILFLAMSAPSVFSEPCSTTLKTLSFRKAFTLTETLVVIGAGAILVSILMPALGKARDFSRAVACRSNIRQACMMTRMYAEENDRLPTTYLSQSSIAEAIGLNPIKAARCPSDPSSNIDGGSSSFTYKGEEQMWTNTRPPKLSPELGMRRFETDTSLILFWDMRPFHGYRNAGYYGGNVAPLRVTQ